MKNETASGPEWEAVRRQVLRRDGYSCVQCGADLERDGAHVHHVLPRASGVTDEPANLVSLCPTCHAAVHPHLGVGLARRLLQRAAVRLTLEGSALGTRSTPVGRVARASITGRTYRSLIYIAVSTANGCSCCIHSHTVAAKQKGMTEAQHMHLLAIIGMASETNNLATAMQVPVDQEYLVER